MLAYYLLLMIFANILYILDHWITHASCRIFSGCQHRSVGTALQVKAYPNFGKSYPFSAFFVNLDTNNRLESWKCTAPTNFDKLRNARQVPEAGTSASYFDKSRRRQLRTAPRLTYWAYTEHKACMRTKGQMCRPGICTRGLFRAYPSRVWNRRKPRIQHFLQPRRNDYK